MIQPPATLGLLGGGQLGRYFAMAAHELGYRVVVVDPDKDCPAGRVADQHLVAGYGDAAALARLGKVCAAVTTEFENVPAGSLAYLAKSVPVHPGPEAVAICQNRSAEKAFLARHGFRYVPYADIRDEGDIAGAEAGLFPGIIKVARFGYDGKGQARVVDRDEALAAFRGFRQEPSVIECLMPLDFELSVVLARDAVGYVACFPAVENCHRDGILDISIAPARAPADLVAEANAVAAGIADRMKYVGTLAVEFFVVRGQLYVNEVAPRPHNSGHYTLDACVTSQFEQQVRALCGLPLGDARAHSSAVMVNLLGDIWYPEGHGPIREPDWRKLLAIPSLRLHMYGKDQPRPSRKMGHFTVTDPDGAAALALAMKARASLLGARR